MRLLPVLAILVACAHAPDPGLRPDPAPPARATTERFVGRDGTELAAMRWPTTAAEPRGVVVIMHGLKDHTGHYAAFAARLATAGYSVYAFDLRGHGRSAGPRVSPRRWVHYVEDLERFLLTVEKRACGCRARAHRRLRLDRRRAIVVRDARAPALRRGLTLFSASGRGRSARSSWRTP